VKIRNYKVLGVFALPLAALAVAAVLLSMNLGTTKQASAAGGAPVDLSLSSTGCDSTVGPTTCNVSGGATFTVNFNVLKFAPGGYGGYDLSVSYSGDVNYVAFSLVQPYPNGANCGAGANFLPQNTACFYNEIAGGDGINTGTAKPNAPSELGNGTMSSFGAQSTNHPANSTYTGPVASFSMVCKDLTPAQGVGTITLNAGPGNTALSPGGTEAQSESLTINCLAATPTPVPTATSTPPPIPRVFKSPALSNIFLHRQGTKIPPARCDDSTDVATLTEQINIPVSTINPKGEAQDLAAFEFEVRFDPTKVCVNLVADAQWSVANNAICTVQDKDSSTLEGIARIGCVTVGKGNATDGLLLATIEVRPQPELYSQIRPNQDNGNAIQILNQGCELADEQGHAIPIYSCEDADITFRYLEGDVDGPDCDVDVLDAQQVAFRWGVNKGSLLYNSFMDLEPSGQVKGDGDIDIKDIQFVFGRMASTCTDPWPAQLPVNPKA
jgi:hypothetical protein